MPAKSSPVRRAASSRKNEKKSIYAFEFTGVRAMMIIQTGIAHAANLSHELNVLRRTKMNKIDGKTAHCTQTRVGSSSVKVVLQIVPRKEQVNVSAH